MYMYNLIMEMCIDYSVSALSIQSLNTALSLASMEMLINNFITV